ncbi:MAG: hypothetical protein AB7T19_02375 [Planctomycetota bacterium]
MGAHAAGTPPAIEGTQSPADGEMSYSLPGSFWSLLRIEHSARSHQVVIPPFVGSRTEVVDLVDGRRRVGVVVLGRDRASVTAGARVELLSVPPSVASPHRLEVGVTDQNGHADFAGLSPGAFLVRIADTGLDDAPPHAQRFLLTPTRAGPDRVIVLVLPEVRVPVHLQTIGESTLVDGVAATLVFRRLDPGNEGFYPVGRLLAGRHSRAIELPVGDYVVEAIPQHAMVLTSSGILACREGMGSSEFLVRFDPRASLSKWRLEGVSGRDFPLQVAFEADGEFAMGELAPVHVGPWHWRIPELEVASPGRRGRVVAVGRRKFVSAMAIDGSAPSERIPLVPGRKLRVESCLAADQPQRVFVDDPLGATQVAPSPRTLDVGGVGTVGWVFETIVSTHAMEIESVTAGGESIWSRRLEAGSEDVILRVSVTPAGPSNEVPVGVRGLAAPTSR